MREILFRGKPKNEADYYLFSRTHKNNCKDGFVYGSLVISEERYFICVSALCSANSLVNNGITTMIEVIPETVGQYTGLTAKNGKIFEGDFLKSQDEILHNKDNVSLVKAGQWNCGCCYAVYGFSTTNEEIWFGDECVIVGNIHDNPELMGGVE